MRIRFLLHNVYGQGGGVLTVTLNLARELAARHDVEIVSVLRNREQPVLELPPGVAVRALVDVRPQARRGGLLGRLQRWALERPSRLIQGDSRSEQHSLYSDLLLLRYLRTLRADALIGMQPGINVAIARFGRRRATLVVQDHRPYRSRGRELRTAYQRYARRLDAFLTLTGRDARHARQELGDKVEVSAITNATPEYTGRLSDQQSTIAVAAGRLQRSKGFDLLVSAWARVLEKHPEWQLRIFGEGELRTDLQDQIDDLGMHRSARLMGFSTALQDEMAKCSLFVLSSRREGYGMVLVEAMSCGLPVVSFDCPTGPREIIGDGVGGVLVPNNDVEALADAIIRMIEIGPDARRELGAAARVKAHQRSGQYVAGQWERLLRKLDGAPTE